MKLKQSHDAIFQSALSLNGGLHTIMIINIKTSCEMSEYYNNAKEKVWVFHVINEANDDFTIDMQLF